MDDVPASLRAGSPATEGYNPFSDRNAVPDPSPPPHPASSVGDYPQRPSLVSTHRDSRQRYSQTSSVSSSAIPSPFSVSDVPSPPAFATSTAYDSAPASFTHVSPVPSRQPSLLSKLGSLKPLRGSRRSRYGRLDDEDEGQAADLGRAKLMDVEEERDDDDSIAFDISAFEGPIALHNMSAAEGSDKSDQELRGAYASLAGTAQTRFAAGTPRRLGSGMHRVRDASEPVRRATVKRGQTSAKAQRREAQKAAEKTGEILAVDSPAVDLSNLDGADYERRSIIDRVASVPKGASETSYYFPPDPDMPSWRPLSMRWWWITGLIVIAVGLGAVQELLCQISMRKGDGDGLLKFRTPQEVPLQDYFTWKYAPTIILLSYGILWQISDFEVKRLEPYYQLSRPTGATASASLNMDYLTFLSYLIPIRAARHRQWAVLFSSLATLMSGSLVPILQSASVKMYPEKDGRSEVGDKYVRIVPIWSRLMSGALFAVALCGMLLMLKLRRKSGLLSDPKGIAGIAAMATQSHILQDFQGLDVASTQLIHKQLAHRRYILHKSSLWQGEYIRNTRTEEITEKFENPHPLMLTLKGGIPYISGIIIVMVLLPVFLFQPEANVVTEKIPFLLTALGTIIKLLWGTLDMDVRIVEPFYILSRRHAPPRTLTLDYTGTMPGYLPVKAFLNRHYLVSAVGVGAIMTEVLTVCMSSFSVDGQKFISGEGHDGPDDDDRDSRYTTDETFKSFWVSFALALGILVYLCVVASLVYAKRRHYFLPRQPGSIASVLAFIHQSNMLVNFVDTQRLDSKKMTKYLENMKGKTYALGWFRGRDGEDHCGIDEEPIAAGYKHGVDWRKGRVTGVSTWDVY